MQQPEEPGEVDVVAFQAHGACDALAEVGDAQGVLNLQCDARVGWVVRAHVCVKSLSRLLSVHGYPVAPRRCLR